MYKVIGKARYSVEYKGQKYNKIRYSLQLEGDKLKGFEQIEGPMVETVCLSAREDTLKPKIGDRVIVSYDVYNGVKKPNGIFII